MPKSKDMPEIKTTTPAPSTQPETGNAGDTTFPEADPSFIVVLRFLTELRSQGETIVLRDRVHEALSVFEQSEPPLDEAARRGLRKQLRGCQEIFFGDVYDYLLLRPRIGQKRIVRTHPELNRFEDVSRAEYLRVKDAFIQGNAEAAKTGLTIDFRPFFLNYPKTQEASAMGAGISVLNRHLAGTMYQQPERFRDVLTEFLRNFQLDRLNLFMNAYISSYDVLVKSLEDVQLELRELGSDVVDERVTHLLRVHGFEPGWGRTVSAIQENLSTLGQVLESADPDRLERLLGALPLTRTVVMVSPHGWFAQHDVLGKPDTGGQVTYVLDQARAIERELQHRFFESGLDIHPQISILTRLIPEADGTTCDQPREKVIGSDNCWIIRVPFRNEDETIHTSWISRFHIWPYLEDFALQAREAVVAEFMAVPDLIIGHYSDGNLVAHRLAEELQTTHCAAVHALEKTKYLLSDLYWAHMEEEYHFSCQFTADLIAYNAADFIISSSYREIGGTDEEMGMFESYETFSMPGLYRVSSGMDLTLARYNIVPPGVSEEHFFPAAEADRRNNAVHHRLNTFLFAPSPAENCVGHLDNPDLSPIFAMSRVDKVKNLPGLIEAYGKSESLREVSNLVIMSSITRLEDSSDQEEIDQLKSIYALLEQYQLAGSVRWCAARLNKVETGEIYRLVADRRGVFAQPAFMETFGLTVIEAMACSLPVVVTCFGGPAEIVIDKECGEVVNPNDHERMAAALHGVLTDSARWDNYSREGIERVRTAFMWSSHAAKVLRLANTYSFWDHLDVMNRRALDQYIHTLYNTVFRPRAHEALSK